MEEKINRCIFEYDTKYINLGELYSKLSKIKKEYGDIVESYLKEHVDSITMLLLLTYQNSQPLG